MTLLDIPAAITLKGYTDRQLQQVQGTFKAAISMNDPKTKEGVLQAVRLESAVATIKQELEYRAMLRR